MLIINLGSSTTIFVGSHYEVTDGVVTKYYFAGAQRIAMRTNGTLSYILGDHLGSTSMVTNTAGNVVSQQKYKAWGEVRYASGVTPTDYTYTGQASYTESFGLMYYGSRFYDPQLGRFSSPDSIIPESQGVQAYDRFAYANNNPVRYNDPTGHCIIYCTAVGPTGTGAAYQAFGLVLEWFFEFGEQTRTFGPNEPITQEVMKQKGMDDFHKEWAESGYEDGFTAHPTIDDRTLPPIPRYLEWAEILIQSHIIDLPLALLGDEDHSAIPGTIGSLDDISATYTEDGTVKIEVHNTMGWASGSRISTWSIFENIDRSDLDTLPGGTTEQYFYWYEEVPNKQVDGVLKW